MNKFCTYIITLTLCILFLASCSDKETKKVNIGVSQCSDDEWRKKMNQDLKNEAIFHHNVNIEIRSADDNNQKQIKDIEYFIKKKVDVLVVSPNEAKEIAPAVAKAYDAGIPVIVADRNVEGDKYSAYIAADNEEIGEMQGLYVAHRLNGKGKIVEITGLKGSTPTIQRHNGLLKSLSEYPDIKIISSIQGDWLKKNASVKMDSLLGIYGEDIDMVVAQNDRMAKGAYLAAKKRFPNNKILFIGIDALTDEGLGVDDVNNGILDATLIYPNGGSEILHTALGILNNEPYEKYQQLSTAIVDKSNAHLLLLQAKEIKGQSTKIQWLKGQVDEYWDKYHLQTSFLYAVIVIAILFMALTFMILRAYWIKQNMNRKLNEQKQELEKQRDQLLELTKQLEVATHSKLMFFTNVSHDFRTPLTLIADPIEQMLDADNLNEKQNSLMHLADKNVKVLLRLINQTLDFRKYENGKMEVNYTSVDLQQQIKKWYEQFTPLAIKKHFHMTIDCENEGEFTTTVDIEKTERIFFNLMGNAIKYTKNNGDIEVKIKHSYAEGKPWVQLSISNTAQYISTEHINHIFERFYQINQTNHEGSGIGLALVKSFVDIQGGKIWVTNEEKDRFTFYVLFPIRSEASETIDPQPLISSTQILEELSDTEIQLPLDNDDSKPTILIVDDNADIRFFIRQLFESKYSILEAENGQQGISLALKYVPDIIICDVMMPIVDGMGLCKTLKTDIQTSHIPIVMLTACSLDEQRVDGLENGADAYISKPFNSQVLIAQVKSLMENRSRLKQFFGDSTTLVNENISNIDKDFVSKFKALIEENLDNSELSVEELGEKLGFSRTQLYRKIKSLTNYSPVELLRIARLKKAATLLTSSADITIAEVSYKVGFTSPSYFAKCYKEYFGKNPSDIVKQRDAK